jgi:hypothetical protein
MKTTYSSPEKFFPLSPFDCAGERSAQGLKNWKEFFWIPIGQAIADLAGSENIQTPHLAEALQYRPKVMLG